ncbi:MAG: tyrosine-protein phosphatase [Oceanospirillaceae bacterium]|nr:tyrosine-protein phosphatase [Oceanospirillaceae bacterium]
MFRKVAGQFPADLYLHSMPGRYESWQTFLDHCQQRHIKQVLCLTDLREIEQKSPSYARAIEAGNMPMVVSIFAVEDFSIPADQGQYQGQIVKMALKLAGGDNLLIHCAAGVGRTGVAAICLLQELGLALEQAIHRVSQAGAGPETDLQLEFVDHYQPRGITSANSRF